MCDKTCSGCPFAFTEESEQIQNYGCLPTPREIVRMKVEFGKTWSCHKDPKKPCAGAIEHLKEKGLNYKMDDKELVTEESDFLTGFFKLIKSEERCRQLEESNVRLESDLKHWRKIAEASIRFQNRQERKAKKEKNNEP